MRNKKFITLAVTLTLTLAITGCSGKSSDTNGQSSATQPQSSSELSTESTDELTAKLDDLYQQENLLFSEHSDAWNKAFSLMNKDNSTADQNMDYADFLSSTIESAKDQFTDEQLAVLRTDIEEIRSIEKISLKSRTSFLRQAALQKERMSSPKMFSPALPEKILTEMM